MNQKGVEKLALKTTVKNSWSNCNQLSLRYLLSIPGLLRILNIILGAVTLGLWLIGYDHQFLGERISLTNGDTLKGYGNGWKREPLNQFVLAAIIICLISSVAFLVALIFVQNARVDLNRMNKIVHFILAIFLLMGGMSGLFGIWFFNEDCCHVEMDLDTTGLTFSLSSKESNYGRHCYCYLTKYFNLGNKYAPALKETVLYDAVRNPDMTDFNQRWTFAAHDLEVHLAAVIVIFLNAVIYFLASRFSNYGKKQKIIAT